MDAVNWLVWRYIGATTCSAGLGHRVLAAEIPDQVGLQRLAPRRSIANEYKTGLSVLPLAVLLQCLQPFTRASILIGLRIKALSALDTRERIK